MKLYFTLSCILNFKTKGSLNWPTELIGLTNLTSLVIRKG